MLQRSCRLSLSLAPAAAIGALAETLLDQATRQIDDDIPRPRNQGFHQKSHEFHALDGERNVYG
jgi:hypothetical protein